MVQEITDRSGWCGGNALAVIIEGTGLRAAASYENDPWLAPVLEVTYDPSTVNFNDTCFRAKTVSRVASSADDVRAHAGGVAEAEAVLSTAPDGGLGTLGLRFEDIDVPQGASVTDARLELRSAGPLDPDAPDSDISMRVAIEPADTAARFDLSDASDVTGRTASEPSVLWPGVPDAAAGELVESPNIASLVGGVVGRPGWSKGNAVALTVAANTASDRRRFHSIDGDPGAAPRLVITYRVQGAQLDGTKKTLRTVRQDLVDTMRRLPAIGGTPLVDAYYEAANYMLGREVDFGRQRDRGPGPNGYGARIYRTSIGTSWTGGTLKLPTGCTVHDLGAGPCRDAVIEGDPVYTAPSAAGSCQSNQIVLLSDGEPTKANAKDRIRSLTGEPDCAVRADAEEQCGIELSSWLYRTDHDELRTGEQNLVTHTVGFNISTPFLADVAAAGGGRYETAASARELADAFRNIVTEAADLNTTIVAPSATVSRSNRLANSNDLYFALFKPSTSAKWDGNLKKYKLAKVGDEVRVVDTRSLPAIDAVTEEFDPAAKSFWSDTADGAEVARGGAAGELTTARAIRTWNAAGDNLELHEDTAAITDAMLGLDGTDPAQRIALLQWARGIDVDDADGDGAKDDARAELGDPLHSTPYLLAYDPAVSDVGSLVFIGTNEGYLHAIDADDDAGTEKFAFVPPKLLANLKAFRGRGAGIDRPYGLDGTISAWHDDTDGDLVVDADESAYLYVGMRRGGRDYYAFDVSDPEQPSLAWTIEGGTGDFAELGQTWSRPVKTRVRVNGTVRDVLILGAGYDEAHDTKQVRDEFDTVGRGIYVVDAATGARIALLSKPAFSDLDHAMPATPRVIDIDLDGLADRIYVGDMGAQLWRFDIDNASTAASFADAVKGAVVADFGSVGTRANRRFYDEPDVALLRDGDGREFLSVAIGSGWRAHPLDDVVEDRFYVVRDYAVYDAPRDEDGVITYPAALTESSLFDATAASARSDDTGKAMRGFYVGLGDDGEKVLGTAATVNGQILFTSYLPASVDAADACGVAVGGGRLWALDALTGDAVVDLDGDGLLEAIDDRAVMLKAQGIPAPVAAMIPEASQDAPVVLVGFEQPVGGLDFGALFRRTFWAETSD